MEVVRGMVCWGRTEREWAEGCVSVVWREGGKGVGSVGERHGDMVDAGYEGIVFGEAESFGG
jgi:hypothetical protein